MDGLSHRPPTSLRTAECATRCGLTARALRVYEKQGLVRPRRDARGWRLYGIEELTRLNSIAVLKRMGFTLAEIRKALQAGSPSLHETLRRQLQLWTARQAKAQHAVELVETALQHAGGLAGPGIDLLCDLVRQFELADVASDLKSGGPRTLSDEERKRWKGWWRNRPEDLAENANYLGVQRALFHRLKQRMDRAMAASSRSVSKLIVEWEGALLRYRVRERACRQLDWDPGLTTAWYRLGQRDSLDQLGPEAAIRELYSPRFADYVEAAYWSSPIGRGLQALLERAATLKKIRTPLHSAQARALGADFREFCARWPLGDPDDHARFAEFMERVNRKSRGLTDREARWSFIRRSMAGMN